MTTKFEADVAAAYKALDERVEIICTVATRLLQALEQDCADCEGAFIAAHPQSTLRLMVELRRVMK